MNEKSLKLKSYIPKTVWNCMNSFHSFISEWANNSSTYQILLSGVQNESSIHCKYAYIQPKYTRPNPSGLDFLIKFENSSSTITPISTYNRKLRLHTCKIRTQWKIVSLAVAIFAVHWKSGMTLEYLKYCAKKRPPSQHKSWWLLHGMVVTVGILWNFRYPPIISPCHTVLPST